MKQVEEDCPAGKLSIGGVCEDCPAGRVQSKAGGASCDVCSTMQYIKLLESGEEDGQTCIDCPRIGVTCDGIQRHYNGDVWHDPNITNPDSATTILQCVNDGCPDAGAMQMRCKKGFDKSSPLCAVCAVGYHTHLRSCIPKGGMKISPFLLFILCIVALCATAWWVWRYPRRLVTHNMLAYLKASALSKTQYPSSPRLPSPPLPVPSPPVPSRPLPSPPLPVPSPPRPLPSPLLDPLTNVCTTLVVRRSSSPS
jgi:hypothetical protein